VSCHVSMQAASADTSGLETAVFAKSSQWHSGQDRHAFSRAEALVSQISKLRAVAPASPAAITALNEETSNLQSEIKRTASENRIDLAKLLKRLLDESLNNPDGKLAGHFDAVRLEFSK